MAYKIAGGSKWWQVRAGHGVEAEWIVMKDEYRRSERERHRRQMRQETKRRSASPEKRAESEAPAVPLEGEDELDSGCEYSLTPHGEALTSTTVIPEMDKLRCMLYSEFRRPPSTDVSSWWSLLLGVYQHPSLHHLALRAQNARPLFRSQLSKSVLTSAWTEPAADLCRSASVPVPLCYPGHPRGLPVFGEPAKRCSAPAGRPEGDYHCW